MHHFDIKSVMTAGKPERRNINFLHPHPHLTAPQAVQALQKVKVKTPKGILAKEVEL